MYNPAVYFGNILLLITFSINSITITSFFIQVIWIFCIKNKGIGWLLFSWALPTPGLRNKAGFFWQYYQCRRNKVFVRVARVWAWPPWLFPFINAASAVPHTTRSADLIPDPIHGISASIFCDIFTGQIEHLLQGLAAWKHTFCLCHFPVLTVQCFYDVGGTIPISW